MPRPARHLPVHYALIAAAITVTFEGRLPATTAPRPRPAWEGRTLQNLENKQTARAELMQPRPACQAR